jgi:hypothetical protein
MPTQKHSKRKAPPEESETTDVEVVPAPVHPKKIPNRAASEAIISVAKQKLGTEASRADSVQLSLAQDEDAEQPSTTAPKKKRKINIFPTPSESSVFNFMPQV